MHGVGLPAKNRAERFCTTMMRNVEVAGVTVY